MGKANRQSVFWATVGRENHQGMHIPARVLTGAEAALWPNALADGMTFKLALLQSQNALVTANGESVTAVAPSAVFLPHGRNIRLSLDKPVKLDQLILFHPRYIFDTLTLDYDFKPEHDPSSSIDGYLLTWYSSLKKLGERILFLEPSLHRYLDGVTARMKDELEKQSDYYWPCRARSFLLQILITCAHLADHQAALSVPNVAEHIASPLAPILTFIAARLNEKLTVDRIAREFGTNRTSLQEKMRRATGLSVTQYLIRLRVQTASILLRNTSLSIPEIMERTGFVDETHFCRSFKKYADHSPAEFRKSFVVPEYVKHPAH